METKKHDDFAENDNLSTMQNKKKLLMQNKKMIFGIISILIIIALVIGLIMVFGGKSKKESEVSVITKSSLEEIIEIDDLSTVDYTYNAVAKATKSDKKTVKYYVAYEGKVTAGIDFEKIKIDLDEKNKKITVTVPEVTIQSTSVTWGTLEYIFEKEKYETETISQEAYKICLSDLNAKIKKDNILFETAKENAVEAVKGLIEPWVKQIDKQYVVEVK